MSKKYQVFLSHNSADKALVEQLAVRLRRDAGLEPFLDKWDLVPGEGWQEALEEALDNSETVAVFLGPHRISPWHNEEMRSALDARARDQAIRVIPVLLPGTKMPERGELPRFLSRLTWVDFRAGIDDQEAFHRLVSGIRGEAPGPGDQSVPVSDAEPYRGLQKFRPEHALWFFGRESETQHLVEHLHENHFLAVLGASGSGKSSVVLAGLVSAVQQGKISGSDRWPVVIMEPGEKPLENLALKLAKVVSTLGPAGLVKEFETSETGLHLNVKAAMQEIEATDHVLLVVDQFEEIFTLCHDEGQRKRFLENILYASSLEKAVIKVVLTMRADFMAKCAPYPDLADRMAAFQFYVTSMNEEQLLSAIVKPAQLAGLTLESGLAEIILRDLADEPGSLPLMEHTLFELWKRRRGNELTLDAYHEIGGVTGALAKTADTTFDSFSEIEQSVAQRILLNLVQLGEGVEDTRRRSTLESMVSGQSAPDSFEYVMQRLADQRLVTIGREEDDNKSVVSISHEALIRSWPRFRKWIDENREELRIEQRLNRSAEEWQQAHQDPDLLYRGARLVEADEWQANKKPYLAGLSAEFLQASQNARIVQRRSARRRLQILAGVSILAFIGMITAIIFGFQFSTQAKVAQSRELAAQSINLQNTQPDLALLLSIQAFETDNNWKTRESLFSAVNNARGIQEFLPGHAAQTAAVLAPDESTMATVDVDGNIIIWKVELSKIEKLLALDNMASTNADSYQISYSKSGKLLAVSGCQVALVNGACNQEKIVIVSLEDLSVNEILVPKTNTAWIEQLAFSNDESMLNVLNYEYDGNQSHRTLSQWSLPSGSLARTFTIDSGIGQVALSPDGSALAWYENDDDRYTFMDLEHDREYVSPVIPKTWEGTNYPLASTFSPNGRYFAAAHADGNLYIFDVNSGGSLFQLSTNSQTHALEFSPDQRFLATGDGTGSVVLWNLKTGEGIWLVNPLAQFSQVAQLHFSPDGDKLATADGNGNIVLWDTNTFQSFATTLNTMGPRLTSLVLFSDRNSFLSVYSNGKMILRAPYANDNLHRAVMGNGSYIASVAFHPRLRILASSGDNNTIRFWNIENGAEVGSLNFDVSTTSNIEYSPDGKFLVASNLSNEVLLWDVNAGTLAVPPMQGHTTAVQVVSFSPNGDIIASGDQDGAIRLWDSKTGQQIKELQVESLGGKILDLSFDSDGKTLASLSSDGTIRLWDTETGSQVMDSLVSSVVYLGGSFALNPKNDVLMFEKNGNIVLWDLKTNKPFSKPLPGAPSFSDLAFDVTNNRLALWDSGRGIYLYDLASGQAAWPIPIDQSFSNMVFSPDGNLLAGTQGAVIQIWSLNPQDWRERACALADRNMTIEEWNSFFPNQDYKSTCSQYQAGQ